MKKAQQKTSSLIRVFPVGDKEKQWRSLKILEKCQTCTLWINTFRLSERSKLKNIPTANER
jgi:hypothetical protein